MMTCEVHFSDASDSVIVSFVYAANDEVLRQALWLEMLSLAKSPHVVNKAWSVLGDFNQVLRPEENSAATSQNVDLQNRFFSQALLDSSLTDLNYRGSSFTRWKKRKTEPIAKKLDRILANDAWNNLFPLALGFFGPADFSDHSSMHVSLSSGQPRQKKPFRFYYYLLKNEGFISIVANGWFSQQIHGSAMFRVARKLKLLKSPIREFSKSNYSGIELRVMEAHKDLLQAQARTLEDTSPTNAENEIKCQEKWTVLVAAEESFFYQRS